MDSISTLGYDGARLDPVTAGYLLGNGYRTYLPRIMAFTMPDDWSPFGAGGLNCYSYCKGDPINFSDPTAHDDEDEAIDLGLIEAMIAVTEMENYEPKIVMPTAEGPTERESSADLVTGSSETNTGGGARRKSGSSSAPETGRASKPQGSQTSKGGSAGTTPATADEPSGQPLNTEESVRARNDSGVVSTRLPTTQSRSWFQTKATDVERGITSFMKRPTPPSIELWADATTEKWHELFSSVAPDLLEALSTTTTHPREGISDAERGRQVGPSPRTRGPQQVSARSQYYLRANTGPTRSRG